MVVKYLLWLTGLWGNSGKPDQLKAAECTETPPELQEAGEYFWDYHCSFTLFCCVLNWNYCPKWEPESLPISHRTTAFSILAEQRNPTSHL